MAKQPTKYEDPRAGVSVTTENGGADAPAGVWEHPETGNTAITQHDPLLGNAQSQAFKRLGFVWQRAAEPEEVVTLPELAAKARTADQDSLKGMNARLNDLEKVNETNKALTSEVEELRAQLAANEKAEAERLEKEAADAEKAAAEDKAHVEAAGVANTPDAVSESAEGAKAAAEAKVASDEAAKAPEEPVAPATPEAPVETPETDASKPLEEQNETELKATAAAEGVEVTPELDTKKKIVAAIQAKRDTESEK